MFTQAIQLNPADHVFYSNRSQAFLNSGNHEKALEDAEACVKYALFNSESILPGLEAIKEKEPLCFIWTKLMKPSKLIRKV